MFDFTSEHLEDDIKKYLIASDFLLYMKDTLFIRTITEKESKTEATNIGASYVSLILNSSFEVFSKIAKHCSNIIKLNDTICFACLVEEIEYVFFVNRSSTHTR